MRVEKHQEMTENPFLGGGEMGELMRLMRSHDWSQTPLGAIETWTDSLKTAVQILLTELDQAQQPCNFNPTATLRQAAADDAFRVTLSNALRPLTDAKEIQATAARILGEHLGASRVIYAEVLQDADAVLVHQNYINGVAELSGLYRLEDYGRNLTEDHWAGRTVIVADVASSLKYTESEKAMYLEIDIAAHLDVPLVKNNQFVCLLAVHQAIPRQWTADEAKRVEETAEQTWAAVERAYAEAKLRKSEAKYRTLFESIDEAFCICEMLFDENGKPDDYRFLEVNPVFAKLTGLEEATGKRARELTPNLEDHWVEIYGRVVRTGESVRFEQQSIAMNRWFNVNAFCMGEPQSNQFAVLFTNISETKRIEAERQKVEQERDRFLAVGSDLQVIMSSHGYFHWVNPAFERILGWTPDEMTSRPWTDFLHPDDILASVAESVSVLSGSETFAFENRYRHKDGSYRWLLWRAQSHSEQQVLYATAVDITERKQAEKTLRESEQRFRLMADAVPQIVWLTDAQGRVEFFNKQWSDYTGVPYEPTTAAEVAANLVHPDDGDRTIEAFSAAQRSGGIFSVEHRIRSAKGSYRWFLVRAEPYRDLQTGEIIRWFGASIDIHDRKQAEATLLQREAQFRQLADAIPQQVWITDSQGNTQYVNQQWATYTGLTLEQTQDIHNATQVIYPDDFEVTSDLWRTALTTGTPYQAEFRLKHGATQTYRWFLSRAIAIRDEQGQIVQWFGTSTDIEEFRRAQAEREHLLQQEQIAREAAENANRIKDEFLAVLSHELRSPLNPILGWTQLLRTGRLDEARKADALVTIERNAKLQAQLIEDLLDISRIMQGKLTLTATPTSLPFVVSAAVETVRLAAEAKNIAIALDFDPEIAPIFGDAARLQQVVWNLLTNAVKFTPRGGQVKVELRQLDRLAQIRVIDTGKGINSQFIPYVFEYFRQEDGSTTRKFGGLGLGLAIVRQIVELHGGTVTAESRGEDQGATFIVQLPAMQQSTPILSEPTHPQPAAETLLDNMQILLVDDDRDTREFQTFLLEEQGAKVTAVASGLEALQALEQFIPNVIVSDIGMPEMDGYRLMQQIRSRPPAAGGTVPAIALTAYAAEIDQKRAIKAGFQTHLTKPLNPERFVSEIINLLKLN